MKFEYIFVLFLSIFLYYNFYENYNIDMDTVNCFTKDGDTYIFKLNDVKLKSFNNQPRWKVRINISFGILRECNEYKSKHIERNMKKIFYDVMHKENYEIDTNIGIFDSKPSIALLKKITDL